VSEEEWAFVAPYLTLCREDAPQCEHALRAVFNGLRYIVRTGNQWRFMLSDLPPWTAVYQQTQRWMRAGVFEILVEDVRSLLREFAGRKPQPTAMIVAAPCSRRQSRERGPDTMAPSDGRAPRCMRRSIRWGICWPCT
jgi:transposase